MRDFLVVQAKTVLKVTSVAPIRNFSPPAVIILGERLNLAQEITYNGVAVKEFIIPAPNRIVARVPETQVGRALSELRVLTAAAIIQKDSLLSLGVTRPLRTAAGIERLVQEFVMIFLSTPGSDLFNESAGGGAQSIIGRRSDEASAELSLAVDRTKQQLFRAQARNSRIPPAERLLSASLANVEFDARTTSLAAVVDLRSVAGDAALVTVR